MAGDWIKVEHATLEKPEVTMLAELLGVHVDQAIGIVVRFWVWLDRNSRHGDVTHVSRTSLDSVLHCAGIGAALEAVGWLKFDDGGRSITVPNFDRHNGNSAKTRALAKDRKANERAKTVTQASRNSHAESVTREEKRREEIKEKKELGPHKLKNGNGTNGHGTRLPDGWALPDEWKAWAAHHRPDWNEEKVIRESLVFRDYWRSKAGQDSRKADWPATWRNWVRRAA